MELLLRHGYAPATFRRIVCAPPAGRAFAVTFDDGWVSMLRHGLPVLARLGVPATVFVAAGLVDVHERPLEGPALARWRDGPHRHELHCLSWDELRGLADAGWEVGAHSLTHPYLTRVGDERLERELRESRRRCEEALGRPCRTMAYPSGDVDARVEQAVADAGYEAAGTLPRRFAAPRPLAWPRLAIQRDDDLFTFRLKVSRVVRAARRTAAWPLADGLRVRAQAALGGRHS